MDKLIFLGTGCGGPNVFSKGVQTSALYIEMDGVKFMLDPGSGAIENSKKYDVNLNGIDGIIVTHPHPDHYTDANCLMDALMGRTGTFLIAGKKCLEPSPDFYPCIGKFQQSIPEQVFSVEPGDEVMINNLKFQAVENNHLGCGLGLKIIGTKKVGYVGDGNITGLEKHYEGMDLLIFNVLEPYGENLKSEVFAGYVLNQVHTTVNQIIDFLKHAKTKKVVIQHFGKAMREAGIDKQAEIIEKETGVKTIAAKDGMIIDLDSI